MTLENGTRIDHYRIVGVLGRGGMADVYRVADERLGREVALKLVPPEFARDPERVERFGREVRAAAKLNHPNIVTAYEFGQVGDQPFYTMALMPGGDLKARIRAHPDGMPPAEARAITAAMARALGYAHRLGFVHRDVKPENILFGTEGTPQLADFGIARAMSSGTRMTATGMSIGSPHYASPEQARGRAVDGRSDLYSLGVVLYEMLTGRVPFDGVDTFSVGLSHINDPAPKLPGGLAAWQPVVDRLLAKSPDDRYGNAGDLAEELALDTQSQPGATQVRPPATRVVPVRRDVVPTAPWREMATRLVQGARPRRAMLTVLAGGALAATVVSLYFALQGPESPERTPPGGGGGGAISRSAPAQPVPPSNGANPFDFDTAERAPADPDRTPESVVGDDSPSPFPGFLPERGEVSEPPASESSVPASTGDRRAASEGSWTPVVESTGTAAQRSPESPGGGAAGARETGGAAVAAPTAAPPSPAGDTPAAPPAPAGDTPAAPAPTAGAKELYYAGEEANLGAVAGIPPAAADGGLRNAGMRYRILRSGPDGAPVEVDPDTVFRAGDRIRFVFEPNIDGFLYVVQRGSTGRWSVLLPHPLINAGQNAVTRFQQVSIPSEGWFRFDDNPGSERVFIYLSRQPISTLPWGGGPVASAQTVDQPTVVELEKTVRSRDLVFQKEGAPGASEQAAYVVNQGAAGDAVAWTVELRRQ